MAEKIKVSQEAADAIEYVREHYTVNEVLETQGDENSSWEEKAEVLNYLSCEQLAIALLIGYEVELTSHEFVEMEYRERLKAARKSNDIAYQWYSEGFVQGIEFVLRRLDIVIKGVNDVEENQD